MIGNIAIIMPEILLATIAIVMQLLAAFFKNSARVVSNLTLIAGLGLIFYIMNNMASLDGITTVFGGSFAMTPQLPVAKSLILGLAIMAIMIYKDLCKIEEYELKMEFVTLVLLSTLGVFISISARDFLLLFCGLELQALAGYALAAFNNHETKSSEAGLKYFILGALMSCIMLLGISFLYGYSGSIAYADIYTSLNAEYNIAMVVGAVLMISAILFKLSAAPVHIWTPDVYEGAPISAVSYFSAAQKIGMLLVLVNILSAVIGDVSAISKSLIKIVAILSMIVGSLGAIMQTSLKRLMAYSSILNIGYVLIGVCLGSSSGIHAAILYMFIYAIASVGLFAAMVALFGKKSDEATFEDLKGIALHRKTLAAVIAIIMFSFVGVPPMAGFFGKYFLFYNAVKQGEIILAIFGVLTSVIAAFYYLKVVKYMYFKDPEGEIRIIRTKSGLLFVAGLSTIFILFFFIFA